MVKITVFYRSNEESNKICSITKNKLSKHKLKDNINASFINLDKRNLQKYLSVEKNIDVVFLWHKEKDNIKFVKENYPNIKVVSYDNYKRTAGIYLHGVSYRYVLIDEIINQYEKSTGMISLYEYSPATRTVEKATITNYEYETRKDFHHYFLSKELAEEYAEKEILENIKRIEHDIEIQKENLIKHKKSLYRFKKDKELVNEFTKDDILNNIMKIESDLDRQRESLARFKKALYKLKRVKE